MKYYTAYYWQEKGSEEVPCFSMPQNKKKVGQSLLLQHFQCGGIEVCLAAICGKERERELLLDWMEEFPWTRAVGSPTKWTDQAEEELEALFGARPRNITILLAIEREAVILGSFGPVYSIRGFFGRGTAEPVEKFRGELNEGTGVLLLNEAFAAQMESKTLGETLRFHGDFTEEKMARRLRELAEHKRNSASPETKAGLLLIARGD